MHVLVYMHSFMVAGFYYTDVILLLMSDEIIWKFREKNHYIFFNSYSSIM